MSRGLLLGAALVGGLLAVPGPATAADAATAGVEPAGSAAKLLAAPVNPVPGQYVVVLDDAARGTGAVGAASVAASVAGTVDGEVVQVFRHALNGFSVRMSAAQARKLAADPRVRHVRQDGIVRTSVGQPVPAPPNSFWGLDRIDQRALPLNRAYSYNITATNVRAYVVDTGIRTTHAEFGGRATVGVDTVGDGGNGQDCNGHGTHVAGTIGGATYGVAKAVKLVAVRVLDCLGLGTESGVIAGVDWVTANAVKPAVVNMSLGGDALPSLDLAVQNSIASGLTYAVAAGNDNLDACGFSPARVPGALTVGSTGVFENAASPASDARSSFSNFGSCVDLFAPGANIRSAWSTANTASATVSGTSMASPHVAGVAALYLSQFPAASPAQVGEQVLSRTTPNVVTNPGAGSPNRLLFSVYKASSTLVLDAGPEPVVRGGVVTVRGKLTTGGRALAAQQVSLYFKPAHKTAYVPQGVLTTGADGSFARAYRQSSAGTWLAHFAGAPLVASSSFTDAVAVR